jgi:hypothetical protein
MEPLRILLLGKDAHDPSFGRRPPTPTGSEDTINLKLGSEVA